jgi:hypothetical protein
MLRKLSVFIPVLLSIVLFASLLLCLNTQPASAQSVPPPPDTSSVIAAATAYLKTQQQPDGGILGFSGVSDPDTTARAVLGWLAANQPLDELVSGEGKTTLDYLSSQAILYTHDITGTLFPGRAGLLLAAVSVAGQDVTSFGGVNLASELEATFQPASGAYSTTASAEFSSGAASDLGQAWAILGLSLAGQPVPLGAAQYLVNTQAADGSWGFGDPDTTALAVTALLASGKLAPEDPAIQNALGFFHTTQLPNGGWRPSWDTDALNADSTGWIIQALTSASQTPLEAGWAAAEGEPVGGLAGMQKPDGSIGGTYANPYSTAEALIGLGQQSLSALGRSSGTNHAGLVVQFGDGSLFAACIGFDEATISGFDLLQRSGLPLETITDPSLGSAVCKIGSEGCSAEDCFCNMPNYWSYWQPAEGSWGYSAIGMQQSQVVAGAVDAWSWGEGAAPAVYTFEQLCTPGQANLAPSASASSMPVGAAAYPEPVQPTQPAVVYPEPAATATENVSQPRQTDTPYPQPPKAEIPLPSPVPSVTAVEEYTGTPKSHVATYVILGVLVLALGGGLVFLASRRKQK